MTNEIFPLKYDLILFPLLYSEIIRVSYKYPVIEL